MGFYIHFFRVGTCPFLVGAEQPRCHQMHDVPRWQQHHHPVTQQKRGLLTEHQRGDRWFSDNQKSVSGTPPKTKECPPKGGCFQRKYFTPPETNIAPENGWLEYGPFSGAMLVLGRVPIIYFCWFHFTTTLNNSFCTRHSWIMLMDGNGQLKGCEMEWLTQTSDSPWFGGT